MTVAQPTTRTEPRDSAPLEPVTVDGVRDRPSRARWVLVVLLPAVAISTTLIWFFLSLTAIGAKTDGFARSSAPGEVSVDVHPDTWYVYVEGATNPRAAEVTVTDSTGRQLPVSGYFSSHWYDHGGREGRAVAKFDVPRGEVGTVKVAMAGDLGPDGNITFAVGNFNVADFARLQRWGAGALLVVNVGAAIAIALAPHVRRRRTVVSPTRGEVRS